MIVFNVLYGKSAKCPNSFLDAQAQSEARLLENIFGIDVSRPLRLDEFRQNLRSSCAEASMALKEDHENARKLLRLEFEVCRLVGVGERCDSTVF